MLNVCGDTELMLTAMLELSPHELYFLPPDTPAVAKATRVEVEGNVFLTRLEYQFRNFAGRDSFILFYRNEARRDLVLFGDRTVVDSGTSEQKISHVTYKCLQRKSSHRFWHPHNVTFGVSFSSWGVADVVWREEGKVATSLGFAWTTKDLRTEFAAWSPDEFLGFCEHSLADPNSHLCQALRWKDTTIQERDLTAFGCRNGDWNELLRLLSLVQKMVTLRFGFFPFPANQSSYWRIDRPWSNVSGRVEPCADAIDWSTRWWAALCDIFQPSFSADEPLFIYRWRHDSHQKTALCQISCGIPTSHEVLEAQLQLREFLRPHLPADEIEALMRP